MFNSKAIFSMLVFVLAFSGITQNSIAEEGADPPAGRQDRLKVGLVLGGGGARGAAHIGVLRELERMRVPIDAIAGTSMGAIVGGLYATGVSAKELEQIVRSMDWSTALSDKPARENLHFRRKQDDQEFPISFELGLRNGDLQVPIGVLQGQRLDHILRELTIHASHVDDYDKLPVPFTAVASDIVRGEVYAMHGGDLARSIRASMSVPGAIAPVEIDGRLLADGGLVGNLPVDIARKMGVDIIIAVDVEFPLYASDELTSAVRMSEQMLTILIRQETLRQIESLGDEDVLIRPDLGTFSSTNFGQIEEAIEPGALATTAHTEKLKSISLSESEYAAYLASRSPIPEIDDTVEFVRVVHDSRLAPELLEARVDIMPGDPVDPQRFSDEANRIYGLKVFDKVGYRLVEEEAGTGVEFNARAKSWGPNFLRFGMTFQDDLEGATGLNLAVRLTRPAINHLGGEWRGDLRLGTDPKLGLELYQPIAIRSRIFIAPSIVAEQRNVNVFEMDQSIARVRISEAQVRFDVGTEIGSIGELRVGAYRGVGENRVKIGDPTLQNSSFDTGGILTRLQFDTRDNAQFPKRGTLVDLQWNLSRPGFGADRNFDTIAGQADFAISAGNNTFVLGGFYGSTLNADVGVENFFSLGGLFRLSGLKRGQISGPHAAIARLIYYRQVGESAGGLFDVPIYLGLSAETGNVWANRSDMSFGSMQHSGSIFAGLNSFLGPVYLAAGFGQGGNRNVYLFIGSPPR